MRWYRVKKEGLKTQLKKKSQKKAASKGGVKGGFYLFLRLPPLASRINSHKARGGQTSAIITQITAAALTLPPATLGAALRQMPQWFSGRWRVSRNRNVNGASRMVPTNRNRGKC